MCLRFGTACGRLRVGADLCEGGGENAWISTRRDRATRLETRHSYRAPTLQILACMMVDDYVMMISMETTTTQEEHDLEAATTSSCCCPLGHVRLRVALTCPVLDLGSLHHGGRLRLGRHRGTRPLRGKTRIGMQHDTEPHDDDEVCEIGDPS